ncbi:BCS1 N terminal-domain-containing protein [Cantharellus anzutake]|uniref:BCS1 N terminal-domain-containing protein n=1 Tax=Cantharellus anzutake TaxID=1750568 RepID=UPI0019058CF3|nr:BCS1 N terminal-domain-containing protein [Cantharellus anzutake]KAF8333166.1 BCS1 N terminal-domain-containing protein [Cantharellus anzutake]
MGVGAGLTVLRRGTIGLAGLARRRLLISLEIPSKDRAYPWFLEWMSIQSKMRQQSQGLSLRSHQLSVETSVKQHDNGGSDVQFSLVPGPGTHYLQYKGAWMQVVRERDSKMLDLNSGTPWETITLTALSRDRYLFPHLLAEAREAATSGQEGKVVIYTAWGAEWKQFGQPRRKRDIRSVVLEDGISKRIEEDLMHFLTRSKWYSERGIPYRRGYLLHGPPGSGKTSFIQALAGKLAYSICVLNLSQRGLMDDKLNHLLMNAPERSFILLEDVDAAFSKRVQTSEDGYQSSVTFSGLLNALDGVASSEERIIFMTTNHLDRLDAALIRPGRVDMMECLGDASTEQAKTLFLRFYGSIEEDESSQPKHHPVSQSQEIGALADELIQKLQARRGESGLSMASLQGHFIRHSAKSAVANIEELFTSVSVRNESP